MTVVITAALPACFTSLCLSVKVKGGGLKSPHRSTLVIRKLAAEAVHPSWRPSGRGGHGSPVLTPLVQGGQSSQLLAPLP